MVELVRGTYVVIPFALVDETGSAVDLTVSGRSVALRLTLVGASSPASTRTTGVSGEYSWTSQVGGTGNFLYSTTASAALTNGDYIVEVLYTATDESKKHIVYGSRWTVRDPRTGSI